jgi:hypothetical protein
MAGCVPGLNARLLCFVSVFPSAIGLRQEGFL